MDEEASMKSHFLISPEPIKIESSVRALCGKVVVNPTYIAQSSPEDVAEFLDYELSPITNCNECIVALLKNLQSGKRLYVSSVATGQEAMTE